MVVHRTDIQETQIMLPKEQYTYYAFSENSEHYANRLKLNIHSSFVSISEFFYRHTYRQAYPAVFKYFLEDSVKYSPDFVNLSNPPQHRRGSHDVDHADGVAVASVIFFKLYEKYGSPELKKEIAELIYSMPGKDNEKKRMIFLKLLQIAAAFHDTGRLGGAADRSAWEQRGANDCHLFILTLLKNSNVKETQADQIAKIFSQAIFAKDQKLDQNKPLLNSFIQGADCIEIMRCKSGFLINYLDIWQDAFGIRDSVDKKYIAKEHQLELQKELLYLSLEWRELLRSQHRLTTTLTTKAEIQVKAYAHKDGFFRQRPAVNIVSQGIHERSEKPSAEQIFEFGLTLEPFSFLRKYYEFSNKNLNEEPVENEVAQTLIPMDDIIQRYVKALDENRRPDYRSIDKLAIALIDLRQTLKEQLSATNITDAKTQLIQNETVILMNTLIPLREKDECFTELESEIMTTAINNYHQKLAHLLNNRNAKIAAAIVFTILAATLLVLSFYILIPAVVASYAAISIATQAIAVSVQIYCSIVAATASLAISGYAAYRSFLSVANEGLSGKIRKVEDEIYDGQLVSPLLFPMRPTPGLP